MKRDRDARSKDLVVSGLRKLYGDVAAVEDVSFNVRPGSLVTLLGPSGCGKTTTLRMIGGLTAQSAGKIAIGGRDVTNIPPWHRNCGFVFQSYALFPHMSIRDNIGYGLKTRGWATDKIKRKVAEVADIMDITPLLDRVPRKLSGGQQQRSAVARALAIEPDILLMDEPLANLDAQLRDRIRYQIRRLQEEFGVTIVYVTHDQAEAFSISNKVLVMNMGKIVQRGRPQEIFSRPASAFVASFVGVNNLLKGRIVAVDGESATLEWGDARLRGQLSGGAAVHDRFIAVVGAQHFALAQGDADQEDRINRVQGKIADLSFMGTYYRVALDTGSASIIADLPQEPVERRELKTGSRLALDVTNAFLIPEHE